VVTGDTSRPALGLLHPLAEPVDLAASLAGALLHLVKRLASLLGRSFDLLLAVLHLLEVLAQTVDGLSRPHDRLLEGLRSADGLVGREEEFEAFHDQVYFFLEVGSCSRRTGASIE
jgi:hypothetical protein